MGEQGGVHRLYLRVAGTMTARRAHAAGASISPAEREHREDPNVSHPFGGSPGLSARGSGRWARLDQTESKATGVRGCVAVGPKSLGWVV